MKPDLAKCHFGEFLAKFRQYFEGLFCAWQIFQFTLLFGKFALLLIAVY